MVDENPLTHFDYYRRAKSLEQQGKYDEALANYAAALEVDKDYAHAWFYKSKLHFQQGHYQDCVECAERALELHPEWSDHITKMLNDAKSNL